MEKEIKTKEEFEKEIKLCDEKYSKEIDRLVKERNRIMSSLRKEYINLLTQGDLKPHIYWQGKLEGGKVKREVLRIYLAEQLSEEKKKKFRYMKFLDLFTELRSGDQIKGLKDSEILSLPIWTRAKRYELSDALIWEKKNETDYFVSCGIEFPSEVLGDICQLLSTITEDSLELRNQIKRVLEKSGISCKIDKKVNYDKMKDKEDDFGKE